MLKSILISIAALLFGIFVTVFGVFLSIFADGNINERLILIAIVLLVLFILSLFFTVIDSQTVNVECCAVSKRRNHRTVF
jgi:cytochrome c biogenesis factor